MHSSAYLFTSLINSSTNAKKEFIKLFLFIIIYLSWLLSNGEVIAVLFMSPYDSE